VRVRRLEVVHSGRRRGGGPKAFACEPGTALRHTQTLRPRPAAPSLHRHQYEEEQLYVLDGTVTIREWQGGVHRTFSLHAGELITWLPGSGPAHQTSNTGERPARYVVMSDRHAHEVAHYPESGKVLLRGAGVGVMTPRGQPQGSLDAHFAAALALPIQGNLNGRTAALFQFDRITKKPGQAPHKADHSSTPKSQEAMTQDLAFISAWLQSGVAQVVDPYEVLGTPKLP